MADTEPVQTSALVNTAIITTINVAAIVVGMVTELDDETLATITAGVNLAVGAWVLVFARLWTRPRVTPEANVRAVRPVGDPTAGDVVADHLWPDP